MADERDPRAERFERYLDALLAGGRPSPEDVESGDEAEMARLAAEIAGAVRDDSGEPDPAFVEQLRLRCARRRRARHGPGPATRA